MAELSMTDLEEDENMATIYAPDPQNLGKFIVVGKHRTGHFHDHFTRCEWCGAMYDREKENCPRCGGPNKDG